MSPASFTGGYLKVTLLAYTVVTPEAVERMERQETSTDAEHLTTLSGRLCYDSFHRPNPDTRDDRDYIRSTVVEKKHFSIVEHSSATFLIEDVSRNLTHELTRHRHLSFSQRSQRYCDEGNTNFVVPPALSSSGEEWGDELKNIAVDLQDTYKDLVDYLVGVKGYKRKQAREAARYILPSGTSTSIVVTGNHRAWYELLEKRLSPQADAEFQALAKEIHRHLSDLMPSLY